MLKKNRNSGGFTLVELLVTIAVLGIAIPGLAAFITNINAMNNHARDTALITSLVENKVESLRSISFVGVDNGTYDFTDELPQSIAPPRQATYTVSSATSALKQVDVEVTYSSFGGERSYSYRTYLGELGVGQY